jgi:hypothetical protein
MRWSGEYCSEFSISASTGIDFSPFGMTNELYRGRRKRPHPTSTQPPPLRDWQIKSLFILYWDEKAFSFRGSTQIPRLAFKGKGALW